MGMTTFVSRYSQYNEQLFNEFNFTIMYWIFILITLAVYVIDILLYFIFGENVYDKETLQEVKQRIKIPIWVVFIIVFSFWIPVINIIVSVLIAVLILVVSDGLREPFGSFHKFLIKKL